MRVYITWSKKFKSEKVLLTFTSIYALECCKLFHAVCNLKDTQMNVQRCLIRQLMIYEFELKQSKTFVERKVLVHLIIVQ